MGGHKRSLTRWDIVACGVGQICILLSVVVIRRRLPDARETALGISIGLLVFFVGLYCLRRIRRALDYKK